MTKKFILWCLLVLFIKDAKAQSTFWKEWFRQKSTQREYLINQIAALQVYIGYARKGYEIYNVGLTAIGQFKNGEFSLHSDYFLSLKGINPEIARYVRVADIVQLQLRTVQRCNRSLQSARAGGFIRPEELQYLARVYGRLLEDCAGLVDELITLTTANKLEMDDDQRLQRIDRLYEDMQGKYRFAEMFGNEVSLLNHSRQLEHRDISSGKTIHNTKTE